MNEPHHFIAGLELTKGTNIPEAERYKIAIEYAKLLYARDQHYANSQLLSTLANMNNVLNKLIDPYSHTPLHEMRTALNKLAKINQYGS